MGENITHAEMLPQREFINILDKFGTRELSILTQTEVKEEQVGAVRADLRRKLELDRAGENDYFTLVRYSEADKDGGKQVVLKGSMQTNQAGVPHFVATHIIDVEANGADGGILALAQQPLRPIPANFDGARTITFPVMSTKKSGRHALSVEFPSMDHQHKLDSDIKEALIRLQAQDMKQLKQRGNQGEAAGGGVAFNLGEMPVPRMTIAMADKSIDSHGVAA
jgi:hypothetical protein